MAGSVSGGCVEGAIYGEAQELFAGADGAPKYLHYGISDELAGDVGLACGGELWVSLLEAPDRPQLRRGAIVTAITGPQAGRRLVFDADTDAADGDLDGAVAHGGARCRPRRRRARGVEQRRPRRRGPAVRRGRAPRAPARDRRRRRHRRGGLQARAAARLADGRDRPAREVRDGRADPARRPDHRQLAAGRVRATSALERADSVIVLTHDAKIDDPALEWAIRGGRRLRRRARLAAHAGPRARSASSRRACRARTWSASTARSGSTSAPTRRPRPRSSIVAEVIAHRSGRTGRALVATTGRIHPTTEPE